MWLGPPPPMPPDPLPVIEVFRADRSEVAPGETVELSWSVKGARTVRLEPPGEDVPAQGSRTIRPSETTTFWLTALTLAGGETRPFVVQVKVPESLPEMGPWIQVGSFRSRDRAEALAAKVQRATGQASVIQAATVPWGWSVFRVRIGPWTSVAEALRTLRQLEPSLTPLGCRPFVTVR